MNTLRTDVREDFEYTLRTYTPDEDSHGGILSEYDVLKAHYFLSDYFLSEGEEVRFGILNYDMLSSAVSRQTVGYNDEEKWTIPIEKIATLLYGLTKDHAFNDGNKRTALLSLIIGLHRINRQVECKKKEFETLLVRIASNELSLYPSYKRFAGSADSEVLFIADFIKRNTRKTDMRFRSLTFNEFNTRLKAYDVWLDNPKGNTINVYKKKDGSFLNKLFNKSQDERITQIGFPGWKRQVNPKAFRCVLEAAGLTADKGFDARVFYDGVEPEYRLIDEYYDVLRRLKDR